MTAPSETAAENRRLHYAEHWPVGTVATQLGVHPDVVRRVLGLLEPRPPAPPRPRRVDGYTDFVAETLARYPRLRATRIFDMLCARGYTGSVRTLRSYVSQVRPRPGREVYLRTEPLIGEQAQVDWAHVGEVSVSGGKRALWLFVVVLAWSRAMWGEFVLDTSVHSLLRSLVRAAIYFGGSCRQWLFDNPKIVVLERHGDAIRFHPLLLDLASNFRVQLRLCAVRAANQKGRVERAIRYLRQRFLAGRPVPHHLDAGNRDLLGFLDQVAHARPHPVLAGRTVGDCLAEERGHLLPLPDPLPPTDLVTPVSDDKTASVRFDRNVYSVPAACAERTLSLVADDRAVRILDGATVVAEHRRAWGRRELVESREHRDELLRRKRGAREAKGRDRLRAVTAGIDELYRRWVLAGRNLGNVTAQTLRLLDLYGDALLAEAVAEILARGTSDPGAIAQVCEQRRRARDRPVPVPFDLGAHVPDRDVIPHDLEDYDADRRRR